MKYVRGFFHFWYDFIVGDDWRLAVGTALLLVVTYAAAGSHPGVWWLLPVGVVALLSVSVHAAARAANRPPA
jgi:hypothetical protein